MRSRGWVTVLAAVVACVVAQTCQIDRVDVKIFQKSDSAVAEADVITALMTSVVLGDPSATGWLPFDSITTTPVFGGLGGDVGEFIVAASVWVTNGGDINQIKAITKNYIKTNARPFVLPNNQANWDALQAQVGTGVNPRFPPYSSRPDVLAQVVKPQYNGNQFIKSALTPGSSGIQVTIAAAVIGGFFECLWDNQGVGNTVVQVDSDSVSPRPVALLGLDPSVPKECASVEPMFSTVNANGVNLYVYQPTAAQWLRRQFSNYWSTQPPNTNAATLFAAEDLLANTEANRTIGTISPGQQLMSGTVYYIQSVEDDKLPRYIGGGVAAGILVIIACGLGIWWYRRRQTVFAQRDDKHFHRMNDNAAPTGEVAGQLDEV